jgi:septum formation protein
MGWEFTVLDCAVDEAPLEAETPEALVLRLAAAKALAGWQRVGGASPRARVLGADTEVEVDGEVLGKPRDAAHAAQLLRRLSGRGHRVLSGVALAQAGSLRQALHISQVRFAPLSEEDIAAYCASGEPMGKAGGYAIQGRAAAFIERLEGSYSGVMGLPLFETAALLRQCSASPMA